jgi:hypothetical protein
MGRQDVNHSTFNGDPSTVVSRPGRVDLLKEIPEFLSGTLWKDRRPRSNSPSVKDESRIGTAQSRRILNESLARVQDQTSIG